MTGLECRCAHWSGFSKVQNELDIQLGNESEASTCRGSSTHQLPRVKIAEARIEVRRSPRDNWPAWPPLASQLQLLGLPATELGARQVMKGGRFS